MSFLFGKPPMPTHRSCRQSPTAKRLHIAIAIIILFHLGFACFCAINGNVEQASREVLLFVLPLIGYYSVAWRYTEQDIYNLLWVLLATSLIVSAEWIWENYYNSLTSESTPYQVLFTEYASARANTRLYELLGVNHRPTGLLEHIHNTTSFVGVIFLVSLMLLLYQRKRRFAVICGLSMFALFLGAARLALLSTLMVSVLLLLFVSKKERLPGFALLSGLALLVIVVALSAKVSFYMVGMTADLDTTYNNHGLLEKGVVKPATFMFGSNLIVRQTLNVLNGMLENPLSFVTGLGRSMSDDFFAVSLIAFYGPIGAIVFFSLFWNGLRGAFMAVRRLQGREAMICGIAACALLFWLLSTLHSGVLHRKVTFALFCVVLGVVSKYCNLIYERTEEAESGHRSGVERAGNVRLEECRQSIS